MDEKDVRAALAQPARVLRHRLPGQGDGRPLSRDETSHPRGWGSAARILGYYVREEKLLRLEEAVRKMTSFAAEAAGIPDRGLVKLGFARRPDALRPGDRRAPARPSRTPTSTAQGIPYVAVNGVLVVDGGTHHRRPPGQALRGPGYAGAR